MTRAERIAHQIWKPYASEINCYPQRITDLSFDRSELKLKAEQLGYNSIDLDAVESAFYDKPGTADK